MNNQNIVMLCQQNWDLDINSSAKMLAKAFAEQNCVLYVNMPLDINSILQGYRQPEIKRKIRILFGKEKALTQVEPNIWVYTPTILCLSINWLSSVRLFSLLNQLNSKLLFNRVQKAIRALNFENYYLLQDGIIFQGVELKRTLHPIKSIYYLRDFTITVPYFRRHGPRIESQLMKQADIVVTNTTSINDYAQKYNSQHSYVIGQGCDLSLYQFRADYAMPADLKQIPGPLIGYTGVLTTIRLDIDLLIHIAIQQPDWNLVLIGPEDAEFANSLLHSLPNVFFLGHKHPEQLPGYLKYFDVCINPQLINEVTIGNYPLKIDEYLAMGKAVVATTTPAMEEIFSNQVYLASGQKQWVELIKEALTETDATLADARVAFAQGHSWLATSERIYEALNIK